MLYDCCTNGILHRQHCENLSCSLPKYRENHPHILNASLPSSFSFLSLSLFSLSSLALESIGFTPRLAMPRMIDQTLMEACVARVLGGEKASAVSKDAQIPYSTLMRYVGRRRPGAAAPPPGRSKPGASASSPSSSDSLPSMPYTLEGETLVFEWMKREQAAGRRLSRQIVLAKAAEALDWRPGAPSTWWFRRFRHRRPEVVGPAAKLSVVLDGTAARGGRASASDASERPTPPATSDEQCAGCASSAAAMDAVERAVRLLQAEYAHKLEAAEMAEAFDVMVHPFYARGFVSMAPSPARDIWLYKQIRQLQGFQEADGARGEPSHGHQ